MDAMLQALGRILLGAVPTFLLVILLHFYLKSMFFKPLEKVLRQRYEATEGARKLAQQSLEQAAAKTASYEAQLRAAKAQMYQAQEQLHKQLQEREAAAVQRDPEEEADLAAEPRSAVSAGDRDRLGTSRSARGTRRSGRTIGGVSGRQAGGG